MSNIEKVFQNGEVLFADDLNQITNAVNDNADKIAENKEAIQEKGQTIVTIQEKDNQQDHTIQQQGEAIALLQQTTGQQGKALESIAQRIGEITAAGYSLVGVISTNINPPAPASGLKVYYIALTGTYTHFGESSMVVPEGAFGLIMYNESWSLELIPTGDAAFINVNKRNSQSAAYASAAAARAAVPAGLRKPGLQITYLLADGWYSDQFIGDDVDDWSDVSKWKVTGPVSVSQNTLSIGGNYAGEMSTTYDVTLHNNGTTFDSLEALLSDEHLNTLIPLAVRKGGMSIKFVRSSDNKYVQYFLTKDEWSTNESDWEKINLEDEVSQLGQKVTPFPYFLDGSVEANKRVKELYLVGLDNTKRYYFKLLRYYSSDIPFIQGRIYSFTLADHSDEVEVARTPDAAPLKGIAVVSQRNSSGISGYVVYDFDTTDTDNITPEINVGVCSVLQLSPTIYAYTKKIGTRDIEGGAVTNEKLSDGSVSHRNLRVKSITTEIIDDNAVTSEKLSAEVRENINSLNVQVANIARIDNVQNLDDFGSLDYSFDVKSGQVVNPAKVGFDIKVVRGSELVFSYIYTNGVYSGDESLYVYFRYEDGTNSSSNRIYTDGRINKFTVPKDVKRITVYVPTQASVDGIVTLNVVQDYNANYGNPKFLIPDYFFANNYLGNKISRIESLIIKCAGVADVFAFTTDEHWQRNAKHSPAIIKYLAEHINFDKYISGGDSTHYWNTDSAIEYNRIRKKAFKGIFLPTVGNHEYYVSYFTQSGKYDAPALYNRTAYAYFMDNDSFVGNVLRGYYYFDDVERKIRYITLSAYQQGQQVDHGNYYSIGAVWGYEQEQLDWLENVALDVKAGWNIIVITHSITGYAHIDDVLVPDMPQAVKPACEILLRYNGNGQIMAILAGHTHRDGFILLNDSFVGITDNPTGNTIPVIVSACDAYNFDDLPGEALENRDLGTINEHLFDIDIADYSAKKIHSVRIGAPADLDFHKSGTLQERIMNYEQKTVSVNGTITLVSGLSGSVTWISKNTDIATVDSSGVVTGVASGSVFVTAIDSTNNISSTFIVKVTS